MHLSADQRRVVLDAARNIIRSALGASDTSAASAATDTSQQVENEINDDPELHQPAGCFVSLHQLGTHRLRGCVGRLDCRDELLNAVRHAAASVLQDPRFVTCPVRLDELPKLLIEATVIFPLQAAPDCLSFDPDRHGIYLTVNDRTGCFLPQVARETGWGRQQLLSRLCTEKLGLPADAWQGPAARLMTFESLIIGPEPFVVAAAQ